MLVAVSNLFNELFTADVERPFLIEGDHTHTYGAYQNHALRIGAAVRAQGLSAGDRLVAQTNKSADGFALWLGCLAAGVVYVPTNTAYTPDEISYFCTDAGASLLVVDNLAALATVTTGIGVSTIAITDLVASSAALDPVSITEVDEDTPAALVYTSGTTGKPKGATLTHGCLLDNAQALVQVWEYQANDILVHSLPIFHVHGLFIALHPTMLSGAQVRFLPRFEPDLVINALAGATVFMGVPTYYHRLLSNDRFDPAACGSMRLFTSGSAPMTELTHAEFTERTGRQVVERYGMSEASIIASNRMDNVLAGSVGHALPGYEIRIVDDDGGVLEAGETGTVEVRGPSLSPGYWNRPDADADSRTGDGWFSTGDVGSLDSTDRLTLEGRSSDMIISGGLNIYPKEIEMVIDEIDGVVESAVVGKPDQDFGEAVTAYLVLEPGISLDVLDVDSALSSLARFKHPKSLHEIDALPRNAMGKVQKNLLRTNQANPQ
jgi:malonyl-CoA/methylmalonyl-CoA synthetase